MGNEQSEEHEVDVIITNIETGLVYKYGPSGTVCYSPYKTYVLYKDNPKYIEYYKNLKINTKYTVIYKLGIKNERVIINMQPIKTRKITEIVKDYLEIKDSNVSLNVINNYYELVFENYNSYKRIFIEKDKIKLINIGSKYNFDIILYEDCNIFIITNFSIEKQIK